MLQPRALFAALLVLSATPQRAQIAAGPSGHWDGTIQMPHQELGITVDLATNPTGVWIGSLSVAASTTVDVPLSNITVDDTSVRFTASLPGTTTFEGRLSTDANGLSGTVSNVDGAVPFRFARNGEPNVKMPPPSSRLSTEFEGAWEGTVDVDGKVRRILLRLSAAADGIAMATLISVDRGNQEIPVTTVTITDKQLQLDARVVSGMYRGTLGANGEIAGEWREGSVRLPLTFRRSPERNK